MGTLAFLYLFLRPGTFLSEKQKVKTKELKGSDQMPDSVKRQLILSTADVLRNNFLQIEYFS
jgi:hypothetical protein